MKCNQKQEIEIIELVTCGPGILLIISNWSCTVLFISLRVDVKFWDTDKIFPWFKVTALFVIWILLSTVVKFDNTADSRSYT